MKQNLSEVILPECFYYEHFRGNENSMPYLGNIDKDFIERFDTSIPIKHIKSITPFRASYMYPVETLVVEFDYPYTMYNNGYVRISQKELIKIINRKKKNTKVYLKMARRYLYIHLKEE